MAEEDKGKEKSPEAMKAAAKGTLVGLFLVLNSLLLGIVAYNQLQIHIRESKRPKIEDVVMAQLKTIKEHEEESVEGEKEKKESGPTLPMESFTANLAQGEGPRRYLRMEIVLKFSPDSKEEEYKARKPQIRDAVINILNAKRPEDVLASEGKRNLKEEIKTSINSFLIDGQVVDIYYTGFQVN